MSASTPAAASSARPGRPLLAESASDVSVGGADGIKMTEVGLVDEGPRGAKTLVVGGTACRTFSDGAFSAVRAKFVVPVGFAAAAGAVDLNGLRPAGGKGGDPWARPADGKYFIKKISKVRRDRPALARVQP